MTLTIKLCRLPIALLLLLLEQLETGTGAGQEQPEALPQRGAKGPKHGSVRRQRPSRTEFRSQVCTGLLSPPPWPPHPPPKWVPTADPSPPVSLPAHFALPGNWIPAFHITQVCPAAAAHCLHQGPHHAGPESLATGKSLPQMAFSPRLRVTFFLALSTR